jgi:hypothetical protein
MGSRIQEEIEHLRFKINSLLNRTVKVQEREFEVLSDAWEKLSEGFWSTKSLVGSLHEFPDVNHMPQEELEELLLSSKFLETQKQKIRDASDKWKVYVDLVLWRRLSETKSKVSGAATYLEVNGIFIKPEIRNQFGALVDLTWHALVEYQMNMEHNVAPRRDEGVMAFLSKGDVLRNELDGMVQSRLWPSETIAP